MPHIYDGRLWWTNAEGRCTSNKFRFNLALYGQGVSAVSQLKDVKDGVSAQIYVQWDQQGGRIRFVSRCTRKYGKRVLFRKDHTILDEVGALVAKVECECRACDVCEDLNEIAKGRGILLIPDEMAIFNSTEAQDEGSTKSD